jgi:hypothetical protein
MELSLNLMGITVLLNALNFVSNLSIKSKVFAIDFDSVGNPKPPAPEKPVTSVEVGRRTEEQVRDIQWLSQPVQEPPEKSARNEASRKV